METVHDHLLQYVCSLLLPPIACMQVLEVCCSFYIYWILCVKLWWWQGEQMRPPDIKKVDLHWFYPEQRDKPALIPRFSKEFTYISICFLTLFSNTGAKGKKLYFWEWKNIWLTQCDRARPMMPSYVEPKVLSWLQLQWLITYTELLVDEWSIEEANVCFWGMHSVGLVNFYSLGKIRVNFRLSLKL